MTRKTFGFFVCYHKDTPRLNNGAFTSIHVGRALAAAPLADTIGDDTGDNISLKNRNYSELTAMYWMLKNVDADYYGLFHYRRMLNFSGVERWMFHDFAPATQAAFGWTEAGARAVCDRFDVVTGPRCNVHPFEVPTQPMSNYDFYCREHQKQDIDLTLEVVKELSPDIYPYIDGYMRGMTCFYGNVFIMRRDVFLEYADWLFKILFEVEKRSDISGYDPYQRRVWGFLSERLMGGFIDYVAAKMQLRIGELPMVGGHFDEPRIPVAPLLANIDRRKRAARKRPAIEPIDVAMLVDDARVEAAAVTLQSAVERLPDAQSLHVHLVADGPLSADNRRRLQTFLGPRHRVTIHEAVATEDAFPRPARPEDRAQLLALQDILPETVRRVIVLDHEAVVLEGLDRLWTFDLDGMLAAACPHAGGVLQARRLNFPAMAGYFDIGVLLLGLERLRAEGGRALYRAAFDRYEPVIIHGAADILNIAFFDRYRELDLSWNVTNTFYGRNEGECRYSFQAACAAARDPALVRFTGHPKPWERRSRHPLTMLYWATLGRTPWSPARLKIQRRVVRSTVRALLSAR